MGLITPQQGTVTIDGHDIQHYNHQTLREQIAYLPEQNILFEGTILDNLTLFRPDLEASAKRIVKQLKLDTDIDALPQGYSTPIGARAVEILAHGFKQRLCIARALMNHPKIILFDEANGAIDVRAETALLKNMIENYHEKCTWIVVSHQFAVLSLAHRIYELRDGTCRSTSS